VKEDGKDERQRKVCTEDQTDDSRKRIIFRTGHCGADEPRAGKGIRKKCLPGNGSFLYKGMDHPEPRGEGTRLSGHQEKSRRHGRRNLFPDGTGRKASQRLLRTGKGRRCLYQESVPEEIPGRTVADSFLTNPFNGRRNVFETD